MARALDVRAATRPPSGKASLALAGLAALLASTCCVVPLAFAIVGISGAWISRLRVLQPYSSALIVLAVGSLAFAAWGLYRRPRSDASCVTGDAAEVDACRRSNAAARGWFWLVAALTLVPIVVPLVAPLFY